MLKNYIITAWRNLMRNKIFSLINIVGLSIGIASCILIFLYLQQELSYDKHWNQAERIVRVNWEETTNGITDPFGTTSFPTGPSIKENFPEVEQSTRIHPANHLTVSYEDKYLNEDKQYFVDTNFLSVFNFELLKGNPSTCLREPRAVVISEAMAKRYFGNEDPIGKLLQYPDFPHKVTGVLKGNQKLSHLSPEALIVIDYSSENIREQQDAWLWIDTYTYLKFREPQNMADFDKKLKKWSTKYLVPALKKENIGYTIELKCCPIADVHFDNYHDDQFQKSSKDYVYLFALVALFILIIACFNYMNLATARASRRSKEIGMRQVVGASRRQLRIQFLAEAFIVSLFALVIALFLLLLFVPAFSSLVGLAISITSALTEPAFWLIALAVITFVSIVGGGYPAFYLSNFRPIEIFRGRLFSKTGQRRSAGIRLRSILVTSQFAISMIIIIATIVVYAQLKLLKNMDLGFNKDQVLVLNLPEMDTADYKKVVAFKNELLANHLIKKFSTTHQLIGSAGNLLFRVRENGKTGQASINISSGDYDYLDLLGIKIIKGRNFSKQITSDKNAFIINEVAAKFLKLSDPLKTELSLDDPNYGNIIGVVKDFNYTSPHVKIAPLVIINNDAPHAGIGSFALVKIAPINAEQSIDLISSAWKRFFPRNPINYYFMDERFEKQYQRDNTMLALFSCFAALTIFISCLGLFGLASFSAQQRTKEIGIRKIVGARVSDIVYLISRDFILLVLISIVIGTPVAWYLAEFWLQGFANRISIGTWIYISAGTLMIITAILTMGSMAYKAANINPVKNLRTE